MLPDSFDKLAESYYLETMDGLYFAVKGHEHPPDRVIAVLRYAPDPVKGDRTKSGVRYRRLYDFAEQEQLLRSAYPQFLAYDPVFQTTLQSVPTSMIRQIHDPRRWLQKMEEATAADPLEQDAVAFARILMDAAGVPLSAMGITGSLLIGMHTAQSDLDVSVFGAANCRKVYDALGRRLESRSVEGLRRLDREGLAELYQQRAPGGGVGFEAFNRVEKDKVCQGYFRRRQYFVRFVKESHESGGAYGTARYEAIGRAALEATVSDARDAIFSPCRYVVADARVLEGTALPVTEIVSFRGRFCEQACDGALVMAAGTLERVEDRNSGIYYRLLLGNSGEDKFLVRK